MRVAVVHEWLVTYAGSERVLDQLHICVCHSPIRYAWDLQHQYLCDGNLKTGIKSWVARWVLHKVRMWDIRAAAGVDKFCAISHFIARRIEKAYRRDSVVIYPPVDVTAFVEGGPKEDFYLAVSRMVPYKRMPMIVEAFAAMPDKRLVIIGDGPDLERCKKLATANVQVLPWQPFEALRDYMQRAAAFIFAAEEDFGITPLEAQACGTPVIAFGKGAALETIRPPHMDRPTGLFFAEQTPQAVVEAVQRFEEQRQRFSSAACRDNVMRFAPERYRTELLELISQEYEAFIGGKAASVALAHRKASGSPSRAMPFEPHIDRPVQDVKISVE